MKAGQAVAIGFHLYLKQSRSASVLTQQSSHALGDQERILFALRAGALDLPQSLFDALLKTRMHGLFLLLPLRAAAKNEYLGAVRGGAETNFQPSMDYPPILGQQLLFEALEHGLGRAHNVAPALLLQILHIVRADHAAIQHPDAVSLPVTRFHACDNFFQRGHVAAVAGKNLIPQRHPFAAHHQGNVDLLAIRTMVAGIAALRQRIGCCLAFEIGTGDVVQQQIVIQREQLPQPLLQMLLQGLLVRQKLIQRTIKPVLVYLLGWHSQ